MVNVLGILVELPVEANEESRSRFEPFGEAASGVVGEVRSDLK